MKANRGHWGQLVERVLEYSPAEQMGQLMLPVLLLECCPAAQFWHADGWSQPGLYVPPAQLMHADADVPGVAAYLPALHIVQDAAPAADHLPAGHALQSSYDETPDVVYLLAGQSRQSAAYIWGKICGKLHICR